MVELHQRGYEKIWCVQEDAWVQRKRRKEISAETSRPRFALKHNRFTSVIQVNLS